LAWKACLYPVSFSFFLIGTALWAFYQQQPELIPAEIARQNRSSVSFCHREQLPAGFDRFTDCGGSLLQGMSNCFDRSIQQFSDGILADSFQKITFIPILQEILVPTCFEGGYLSW